MDEGLVQLVDERGAVEWRGTVYRHTTANRDPLSGEGARRFGGRWNPADSFAAIYLADPEAACMAELERQADSQGLEVGDMLRAPRTFHTIEVAKLSVLDLRATEALEHLGLEGEDLTGDDWTACQAVGQAAHFLGMGGVLAPSASGIGVVLTAFEARVPAGGLVVTSSRPLDWPLYEALTSTT